jgi:hypothetical protein
MHTTFKQHSCCISFNIHFFTTIFVMTEPAGVLHWVIVSLSALSAGAPAYWKGAHGGGGYGGDGDGGDSEGCDGNIGDETDDGGQIGDDGETCKYSDDGRGRDGSED